MPSFRIYLFNSTWISLYCFSIDASVQLWILNGLQFHDLWQTQSFHFLDPFESLAEACQLGFIDLFPICSPKSFEISFEYQKVHNRIEIRILMKIQISSLSLINQAPHNKHRTNYMISIVNREMHILRTVEQMSICYRAIRDHGITSYRQNL